MNFKIYNKYLVFYFNFLYFIYYYFFKTNTDEIIERQNPSESSREIKKLHKIPLNIANRITNEINPLENSIELEKWYSKCHSQYVLHQWNYKWYFLLMI